MSIFLLVSEVIFLYVHFSYFVVIVGLGFMTK